MTAVIINGFYYDPNSATLGDGLTGPTARGFRDGRWRTNLPLFFVDFVAHVANLVTSSINGSNIFGHEAPSSATTITLTNSNKRSQAVTMTAGGQAVKLPDATTITKGERWVLRNAGSNAWALQDNAAGVLVASLAAGDEVEAWCEVNGTAAGTWRTNVRLANARLALSGITATGYALAIAADAAAARNAAVTVQSGGFAGLGISNDAGDLTHDINIAVGECLDSTRAYRLALGSALVKQLDATWAVGSAAGGKFSGASIGNNATGHVFLIRKDSDGSIDAGFDSSITAANKPAGYTCYRRVGSFRTDGTGLIRAFTQVDTRFLLTTPVSDIALSNTSATGWSSATAISVPSGLRVEAFGALQLGDGNANSWQMCSLSPGDITLPAPALNTAGSVFMYGSAQSSSDRHSARWSCITNTSGQIKYALGSFSGLPTGEFWLDTHGWDDLTLWRL